jgi:hypothetical protein
MSRPAAPAPPIFSRNKAGAAAVLLIREPGEALAAGAGNFSPSPEPTEPRWPWRHQWKGPDLPLLLPPLAPAPPAPAAEPEVSGDDGGNRAFNREMPEPRAAGRAA